MDSIYAKLAEIQANLKAPKNQRNDFGKYSYRSCEDILTAVKPLLAATKTALTIGDEVVEIAGRVYVKATATLIDVETGGSSAATAFAREEETRKGMDASQITGSTSSYARKYALNGLFAIDDTKDADATNTHDKEQSAKVKPTYLCESCGAEILPYRANGKTFTAQMISERTRKKYGKALCARCAEKVRNENADC